MIPFLSKFLRNFPAIQTKQILNLLSEARDKGEIVSSKDLKEQLDQLAEIVSEEELKIRAPFLFFQDGDTLESDAVKTFIKTVQLDTEACLGEVENIGNSIRAHHKLLVDNYFSSIEASIVELERKVSAYELLSKYKTRGFNRVFSYSFDGGISVPGITKTKASVANEEGNSVVPGLTDGGNHSERSPDTIRAPVKVSTNTSRKDINESLLEDERGEQTLYWSPPHYGEQGLCLSSEESYHKFVIADLIPDNNTTSSVIRNEEKNIVSGNHIYNILDDDPDTYWSYSVKTADPVGVCQIKIFLGFQSSETINAIAINPVSDYQMFLTNIAYIGDGGSEVSLDSFNEQYSTGLELPANSKIIVDIENITAKAVFLTFKQPTADRIQGTYLVDPSGNFKNLTPQQVTDLRGDVDFPGLPQPDPTYLNYMNYSFGFKDITAITREYKPNGLFVTEKKKVGPLSVLSVDTFSLFPRNKYTDIEVKIEKENYIEGSETPVDTEIFPVLPVGTEVANERLFLTEQTISESSDDTGLLRFFPDFEEDFKVYNNQQELVIATNYEVSIDDGKSWETSFDFSGSRSLYAKCKVRILQPRTDKIYTVSYKPLVSSQETDGQVFLNSEKTVQLERDQVYKFETKRTEGKIYKSYLTLQFIFRSNTLDDKVTPYLKGISMLYGVGHSDG